MCHAYSITTNVEAIRQMVQTIFRFDVAANIGNLAPQIGVYPDMLAPIIRNQPGFRELIKLRWGLPTSSQALYKQAQDRADRIAKKQGRDLTAEEFAELVRMEPDRGTHNVRNTKSAHWKRWLGPEFRCIVPFTSFAEVSSEIGPDGKKLGNTWFAFDDSRPLAFFAGIFAPQWTSVRKTSEGMITTDLFAFLTTDPNNVVAVANPDAMPVILRTPEEIEIWMTAPWEEAQKLQRPLPDGVLQIVSIGNKEDPPEDEEPPPTFAADDDPQPSLF
jgi:putative SOS response-associated peptidase YedK